MTPNLKLYDYIVVNTSAGKDSLAMLAYIAGLAKESGVLHRVVAVHADLGRVEWPGTPELAERQAERFGVQFVKVKRSQNDLLDHIEARGRFPSPRQRYCTSDHKRAPVHTVFTQITTWARQVTTPYRFWLLQQENNLFPHGLNRHWILNCMGMRADESPARAKLKRFETDERASNGKRRVDRWLPLHNWDVARVWGTIKNAGADDLIHPCYALGMPRCSCCFCIFAPKEALVLAGHHNPELLAEYVRVENKIGHRFRVDLSMADVAAAVAAGEKPATVGDWRM